MGVASHRFLREGVALGSATRPWSGLGLGLRVGLGVGFGVGLEVRVRV